MIIMFDGRVLTDPSNTQIAEAIGVQTRPGPGLYDVAVIGAGPAGLAAAVYGSSEGLSTVVLEPEAIGGQAGTSSHIRNYLGFPTGVSGEDLAVRAYTQAWNFGTEYVYGNPATGLRVEGPERVVTVAGGGEVRSRAVIIATGVSYRRLGIPSLDALTGVSVFYGAATSEAKAMKDREVFVVGGANSAGQAAVHLARYAARVTMLVRGQSLADSMSEYLVKEITSTPNIAVRHNAVVTGGAGTGRLESLTFVDQVSGVTKTVPAAAVFVMIGAEPRTQWLPEDIRRDRWGYVVTGADLMAGGRPPESWPLQRPPMFLESSLPGVFAVGDVRCGSVKRVASAVGEGSVAIRLIHDYLRGNRNLTRGGQAHSGTADATRTERGIHVAGKWRSSRSAAHGARVPRTARPGPRSMEPTSRVDQRQGLAFTWRTIKGDGSPKRLTKIRFRRSCELALLCGGRLLGGLAELLGGALAGFPSHLKLRLHFLKVATAPGEVLFDSAEGFTVLLQASLEPLLCLRSLIQSMLRAVE